MYTQSEFKHTFLRFYKEQFLDRTDNLVYSTFLRWWRVHLELVVNSDGKLRSESAPFLVLIAWLAKRLVYRFNEFGPYEITDRQFMVYLFDMFSNHINVLSQDPPIVGPVLNLGTYSGSWFCFAYLNSDWFPTVREDHLVSASAKFPMRELGADFRELHKDYHISLSEPDRLHFELKEHHRLFGFEIPVFSSVETLNYNNTRLNVGVSGPFSGNCLVINWDRSMGVPQWAVVGDFDLRHLVFLTRAKIPQERELLRMMNSATAFGYYVTSMKFRMVGGAYEMLGTDDASEILRLVRHEPPPKQIDRGSVDYNSVAYVPQPDRPLTKKAPAMMGAGYKSPKSYLQGQEFDDWSAEAKRIAQMNRGDDYDESKDRPQSTRRYRFDSARSARLRPR